MRGIFTLFPPSRRGGSAAHISLSGLLFSPGSLCSRLQSVKVS